MSADDARACGGCFHEPPPPTVTVTGGSQVSSVITDHRMVLALSSTQTTLWDQVEYNGEPYGFAWVLPIRGPAQIGVGTDRFVDTFARYRVDLNVVVTPKSQRQRWS